jgi:hypothetical protein
MSDGMTHGVIGCFIIDTAPVPIYNVGGFTGYSVSYKLMDTQMQHDITGVPNLTFDLATSPSGAPLTYPLAE